MAAIETVTSATATNTAMDDESINPDFTEDGCQIFITLTFASGATAIDMNDDIYDMVNDKFGTIATNKVPARGCYEFYIT